MSKTKDKPAEPESDIEVIAVDDDRGTFTAKLFGTDDEFVFWSDANFLLLLIAYGGEGEDLAQLSTIMKGLLYVDEDAKDIGAATRETWGRFLSLLAQQRKMTAERSMRFINDLVAAAGKDQQESADD